MGNYSELKDLINNPTSHGLPEWDNGDNKIEGEMMKSYLLAIVNSLSSGGYLFAGVAKLTPTQTDPGTPDQNVFYIAAEPGTYTNKGGLVVNDGEVAVLKYNGSWSKEVIPSSSVKTARTIGQLASLSRTILDPSLFEVGGISGNVGSVPTKPTQYFRIRTADVQYTATALHLTAESGFRFYVMLANSSGVISSKPGWKTDYTIAAGSYYWLMIGRDQESNLEVLGLSYLITKVTYETEHTLVPMQRGIAFVASETRRFAMSFDRGDISFSWPNYTYIDDPTRARTKPGELFWMNIGDVIYIDSPDYVWDLVVYGSYSMASARKVVDSMPGGTSSVNRFTIQESSWYSLIVRKAAGGNMLGDDLYKIGEHIKYVCNYYTQKESEWLTGEVNLFKYLGFISGGLGNYPGILAYPANRAVSRFFNLPFSCTLTIDKTGVEQTSHTIRFIIGYRAKNSSDSLVKTDWNSDNVQVYNIDPAYEYAILAAYTDDSAIVPSDLSGVQFTGKLIDAPESGDGILALNPESEVLPKLLNLERVVRPAILGSTPVPIVCFLHFSDLHNDNTNLLRIKEFADKYSSHIDKVISTGDMINAFNQGMPTAYAQTTDFINIIGNHEASAHIGGEWVEKTSKEVYDLCIAPYVANWGVVQPSGALENGYNYFYKDYADSNLRMIFVDCEFWTATQKTWFEGVLEDARTNGYHVVCYIHRPPFIIDQQSAINPFTGIETTSQSASRANAEIAACVQTFINAGGIFAAWFCGHIHQDVSGFGRASDGYQTQFAFSIACAGTISAPGYADMARGIGNRTQDCFNLVGIDTNTKTIKIVRIGANYDRFMRRRNTISINYATAQIIYADM